MVSKTGMMFWLLLPSVAVAFNFLTPAPTVGSMVTVPVNRPPPCAVRVNVFTVLLIALTSTDTLAIPPDPPEAVT